MPRTARLDAAGVLHHIMIRGIERRKIFLTDDDREDLVKRLAFLLPETGTSCYAWTFIPNHAHFLFRTGHVPVATLMRRLLTGYAIGFNHRHNRCGQLFQNRYKSIICQEDVYFKELVRYIHLNPIRSGIVSGIEELDAYPYCGHAAVMSLKERAWQDVEYVLRSFGRDSNEARQAYHGFMVEGLSQGRRDELTGGGLIRSLGGWKEAGRTKGRGMPHVMSDERILGDPDFVASVLSPAKERLDRRYELKRHGYDLNRIAERVAEILHMDIQEVLSRGRRKKKVEARSLLCFWAVREAGMSLRYLAEQLEMSAPGVGFAVERGEALARQSSYRLID